LSATHNQPAGVSATAAAGPLRNSNPAATAAIVAVFQQPAIAVPFSSQPAGRTASPPPNGHATPRQVLTYASFHFADGMFDVEYADIMGIPFDFAAQPVVAKPKPPKPTMQVKAIKGRAALEIVFPRVEGYRIALPDERIDATFIADSRLILTPEKVGPSRVRMEGIVGEGIELTTAVLDAIRPSEISYHLAKHLLFNQFRDPGEPPKMHLFGQIKRVAKRWLDEDYLVCLGDTKKAMVTYREMADQAAELIFLACQPQKPEPGVVKAILDPYTPTGSTRFVNFSTSKPLYTTSPTRCHVNHVVLDSDWEAEFVRVAEAHPLMLAYVKSGYAVRGALSQGHSASPLLARLHRSDRRRQSRTAEPCCRGQVVPRHRRAAQGGDDAQALHVDELRHPDDAPIGIEGRRRLADGAGTARIENRFRHQTARIAGSTGR
jgi:hypothetical protein